MSDNGCKCEGLILVRDMIAFYMELGKRTTGSTPEQQKEASILTDRILARVSEEDVHQEGHSPKLMAHFIEKARDYNKNCKEGQGFDCMLAIEGVRAALHGDWGLRAKILCDPKFEPGNASKDNEAVWWSQYQLRGWGTPEGALKLVEDRMKVHGCAGV